MVKSRSMRVFTLALCIAAMTAHASPATGQTFSVPVTYKKLPNGLRVVISENHVAPVVVVEVMYRIGFRIEPRFTFTLPALLDASLLCLHIEGQEKRDVLNQALAEGPVEAMPIRAVLRSKKPLTLYWCP